MKARTAGLTGYQEFSLRAYMLENVKWDGKSIKDFRAENPEYRIVNVRRGDELLGAEPNLVLKKGDSIALGGARSALTDKMGLIGPEIDDVKVLNIPLDQAEILVTNKEFVDKPLRTFRNTDAAGQVQITKIERAGNPIPLGLDVKLQRMDVVFVAGLKSAVQRVGDMVGRIARPSTATDISRSPSA